MIGWDVMAFVILLLIHLSSHALSEALVLLSLLHMISIQLN